MDRGNTSSESSPKHGSASKRRRNDDSRTAGGKVRVFHDGGGNAIATHYNHLPESGRRMRTKSRIYFMRNFNNWVKSVLLKTFQDRLQREGQRDGINALDLGCGKGGDLLKWRKGNVRKLICTDIAGTSIEQCRNRYELSCKQTRGKIYQAEFLVADSGIQQLAELYKNPKQSFDLSSCQFVVHYSFESETQATMMVRNLCENVRKGGYFIGTTVNSDVLRERLDGSDTNSFGNSVYQVAFDSKDEFKDYGHRYNFKLEGVVDCHEFVLKRQVMVRIAEKFGMKLVLWQTFSDFFAANCRSRENKDLLKTIKALEEYPSVNRSGEEPNDYSHAEEVITDIKKRKPGSNPKVGTLSLSEWDAASLYIVFAFKKVESEDETFEVPPSTRDDIPLLVMST